MVLSTNLSKTIVKKKNPKPLTKETKDAISKLERNHSPTKKQIEQKIHKPWAATSLVILLLETWEEECAVFTWLE